MNAYARVARLAVLAIALTSAACGADAQSNPNSPSTQVPLRGIEWSLIEIDGKSVATAGRRPTLLLATDGGRATGYAGCNQFSASYTATDDVLRVSALAMTRMFCAESMQLENRYVSVLGETRSYRITAGQLELLDERKSVVAKFEKR